MTKERDLESRSSNPDRERAHVADHGQARYAATSTSHAAHRTKQVKIRGLALNPPNGRAPIEVFVTDQRGWDLVYKNPAINVKCVVEGCDTLLTAKRMSRSGVRFFAVRSGGCSHNLIEVPVERGETEQDPSKLGNGGGPEGQEHLWMKGRLYRIARKMGEEAVVEHSMTRADVFLPRVNRVLEYQRWGTDFRGRTEARSVAGAKSTLWMFPRQPPGTARARAFNREVFQNGGIYVAVRNKDDFHDLQRPWEDRAQESTALLYASGSVVWYKPAVGHLVHKERSLYTVLKEIINEQRVLVRTPVLTRNNGLQLATVWALREDLEKSEAERSRRRHRHEAKAKVARTDSPTPSVAVSDTETGEAEPLRDLPTEVVVTTPTSPPTRSLGAEPEMKPETKLPQQAFSAPPPTLEKSALAADPPRTNWWTRMRAWARGL